MPYFPRELSAENLLRGIQEELTRISAVVNEKLDQKLDYLAVAPSRPRDGMIVAADGVNWNPGGGGKGVYVYITNAWVKL